MKIKIYQINPTRDKYNVCFCSYELMQRRKNGDGIDTRIYDLVFSGTVDCKNPEEVYAMFNLNIPRGYLGRSMSVSDIIEVINSDTESEFYYCQPVGFLKLKYLKFD